MCGGGGGRKNGQLIEQVDGRLEEKRGYGGGRKGERGFLHFSYTHAHAPLEWGTRKQGEKTGVMGAGDFYLPFGFLGFMENTYICIVFTFIYLVWASPSPCPLGRKKTKNQKRKPRVAQKTKKAINVCVLYDNRIPERGRK